VMALMAVLTSDSAGSLGWIMHGSLRFRRRAR
jgi:hypothetical protein